MFRSSGFWLFIAVISVTALFAAVPEARAEITLDLEVREAYEDNVIGLAADNPNIVSAANNAAAGDVGVTDNRGGGGGGKAGGAPVLKKGGDDLNKIQTPVSAGTGTNAATGGGGTIVTAGDFSTNISLDAGISHDLGDTTTLLLSAGVDHTAYSTYTQFDFTIAALRAGIAVYLTDSLTGKVVLRDAVKRFDNSDRNANAFGATFSLKERFTPTFWLKGVYDVEQNNADSSLESYLGNSYSIWAGYALTTKITAGLGYSYLTRDFKSSQFRLTSKTVSADLTWDFTKNWSVNAGFDQEHGDSNIPGSATIDNIYSVGLMYSY